MINNLYLKKFAGQSFIERAANRIPISDKVAMMITEHPELVNALAAGLGGVVGYNIPGSKASKVTKLLSGLSGALIGGGTSYYFNPKLNKLLEERYEPAVNKAFWDETKSTVNKNVAKGAVSISNYIKDKLKDWGKDKPKVEKNVPFPEGWHIIRH